MCLTVINYALDNKHIKTAECDLVVYKVYALEKYKVIQTIRSPIQGNAYILSKYIKKLRPIIAGGTSGKTNVFKNINKYWKYKEHINHGIHAYVSLKEAKNSFLTMRGYSAIIIKCIIPKGEKYILGTHGHIVTTKIYLEKIV